MKSERVTLAAALPWITLAAGITIIAIVAVALATAARDSDELRFTRAAEEMAGHIEQQVEAHISLLRATHAFLQTAGEPVGPETFRAYVSALRLRGRYFGIQGIGYIHRVPAVEAAEAERALAPFYDGNFHFWPLEGREVLYPVVYLEPPDERNKAALGFDFGSEATRRQAMEQAAAARDIVLSGIVTLKQEIGPDPPQPGFIVIEAVRRAAEAASEITGFAYAAFRARDFFTAAIGPAGSAALAMEVFDGPPAANQRLFRSSLAADDGTTVAALDREIAFGGRSWSLRFTPTAEFSANSATAQLPYVGLLAVLLAGALGYLTWQQFAVQRAAAREAELLRSAGEDKDLLLKEMSHRIKNVIARVQAIAHQTTRSAAGLDDFQGRFDDRLTAMSKTYDLLTRSQWSGASLGDVLRSELLSLMGRTEFGYQTAGPEIQLGPREVVALGLAFHELTTNALKYGALAHDGGSLSVEWTADETPAGRRLRIVWKEVFAVAMEIPQRQGFGSRLIDTAITRELNGEVERDFRSDRLTVVIAFGLGKSERT